MKESLWSAIFPTALFLGMVVYFGRSLLKRDRPAKNPVRGIEFLCVRLSEKGGGRVTAAGFAQFLSADMIIEVAAANGLYVDWSRPDARSEAVPITVARVRLEEIDADR